MTRPLIGITSYAQSARWGAWELPCALIPLMYVEAVERAGGRSLVVPPSTDGVDETLAALDGVLFAGGADIDPAIYGAAPHATTDRPQPLRDRGEMALLAAALEQDIPVLAICRGVQLLNVARGGDLVQHLPETVGHAGHLETPGAFSEHEITVRPGTRLMAFIGAKASVKSHHHQGLGRIGKGLVEAARATDGTVEALEDPSRRFALGVLWHPEADDDWRLFEAFVAAASRLRESRRTGDR